MQPRNDNPVLAVSGAMTAFEALVEATQRAGVPKRTLCLVARRASQINGCGVCAAPNAVDLEPAGEPDEGIMALATWRETPYFSDAERAALALTEAATRPASRSAPVPAGVWADAAAHYDEAQLAALVVTIAATNALNRINATTRQITGQWTKRWIPRDRTVAQPA